MATNTGQKRYQRLGWPTVEAVGLEGAAKALQTGSPTTSEDIYDIAWDKSQRLSDHAMVGVRCFAIEDYPSATSHAREALRAADDFFFGPWRSKTYKSDEGKRVNANSLRRDYNWMFYFEAALLWASVLGEWQFLKKLGAFPQPDSRADTDFGPQYRDLYVALGAFFCGAEARTLNRLLERASSGPKTQCKLGAALIRAAYDRDAALLQKGLTQLLKHYKKSEFPKKSVSKRISIHGTLFVHWAEKEKLALTVPPEFADHIVRLP